MLPVADDTSTADLSEHQTEEPLPAVIQELQKGAKYRLWHRAMDGHLVRSKSELIVDNWLYHYKISHAYGRKLPLPHDILYCDFYIDIGRGVYIEYWGYEFNPGYLARKQTKIETYHKYHLPLIELTDKDISQLDNVLPQQLIQNGLSTEYLLFHHPALVQAMPPC